MRVLAVLFLCASASSLEMTAHSMTAGKKCYNNLDTNGAGNGKFFLGPYDDQAACESACADAAIIAGFTKACCQFRTSDNKCWMSENFSSGLASGAAAHFASIVDNLHSMNVGNKCLNNGNTNGAGNGKHGLGNQTDHAACESACELAAIAAGFTAGCCQFRASDNRCWWSENSIIASASNSVVHFASTVDNFHSMNVGNKCLNNGNTNGVGNGKHGLGNQTDHAACESACELAAGAAGFTEGCCQFTTHNNKCYWSENAIIDITGGGGVKHFASIVDAPACSVSCSLTLGIIKVTHDTGSAHTHHRCFMNDNFAGGCECECAMSAFN